MDFSPYLQAVQLINGETPGEKYRTLNEIARNIAAKHPNVDTPIRILPSHDLPEKLIPWVTLEVADLLRRPQEVAIALQSEDTKVFNRALRIKWYFTGNIPNYSDVDFFVDELFPKISLINRLKIIRALGQYLRPNPDLAEIFYGPIAAQYGYDVTRPILLACNAPFLWNKLINYRIILNEGEIKYLYHKFPRLVIYYLKKSVRVGHIGKPFLEIYIDKYMNVLPILLKKHLHEFIGFIQKSSLCSKCIRLSRNKSKLMLRVGIETIVKNPVSFLPLLSVKYTLKKLKLVHCKLILQKLLSNDLATLNFEEIKEYFEYMPVELRVESVTSTCTEKYGQDWLDNFQNITPTALRVLPPKDRIKLAWKKFKDDQGWYLENNGENIEKSWRCYIKMDYPFYLIKLRIRKREGVSTLMTLMRQLILVSEINNDSEALLSTLFFITTQFTYTLTPFTSEEEWQLMDLLLSIINRNSSLFGPMHWYVIYDYIRYLKRLQGTVRNEESVRSGLIKYIHYCIITNQSIKEKINLLTEIYLEKPWIIDWNILKDDPRHERLCLEEFSTSIVEVFFEHREKNTYQWREICITFLKAIYNFNHRHCRKARRIRSRLSIRHFPWLLESIEGLLNQSSTVDLIELADLLKRIEPDMLPPEIARAYIKRIKFFQWTRLQNIFNPRPTFRNYRKYYEECRDTVRRRSTQTFLRFCRWHQDIPIRFVELALKDFTENQNYEAILVLSILVEGPEFDRFITPFIPHPERITSVKFLQVCVEALKYITPMVSVDFIRRICEIPIDDFIIKVIMILRARMGANRVIPLFWPLNHKYIHLFQYSMDAIRIVTKLDTIVPILQICWRQSKQDFDDDDIDERNKRYELIRNMLIVFETKPCMTIWSLVNEWLDDLNVEDEPCTLGILSMFDSIPAHWLGPYLEKVIITIERLALESNEEGHWAKWYKTDPLIDNFPIDVPVPLSDRIHGFLISTHWDISHTNRELLILSIKFFINSCTLLEDYDTLENRLEIFSTIFKEILQTHWRARPTNTQEGCTIIDFLYDFAEILVFNTPYCLAKNRLVEEALASYLSELAPHQDTTFFCYLYFSTFYCTRTSAIQFIDKIHSITPIIFGFFRTESIDEVVKLLHRVMKHFYGHQVPNMILHLLEEPNRVAYYLAACLFVNEANQMSPEKFQEIWTYLEASEDEFVNIRALRALEAFNGA